MTPSRTRLEAARGCSVEAFNYLWDPCLLFISIRSLVPVNIHVPVGMCRILLPKLLHDLIADV